MTLKCRLVVIAAFAMANAQTTPTLTTLYSFAGTGAGDGAYPSGGLVRGKNGALYGVTQYGGTQNFGAVYRLTPPTPGQSQWKETVLYSFTNGAGGYYPSGTLAIDSTGSLYGTTISGGNGYGVVYKLSPPTGAGTWTETVLYAFGSNDLQSPSAGVIFDSAGNLYGNSSTSLVSGPGGVFKLIPPAGGVGSWTENIIYAFTGVPDGNGPVGSLIFDKAGNLYGATTFGGIFYDNSHGTLGTVFELTPPNGSSGWTESQLYAYPNLSTGFWPASAVVMDTNGNLFGVTLGDSNGTSTGAVFELTPPGVANQPWTETLVHAFKGSDGGSPNGPVVFDSKGSLYGTTANGTGAALNGEVFKFLPPLTPGGPWRNGWHIKFNSTNGAAPIGNLVIKPNGTIYGATSAGGLNAFGTVYQIQP